MLPTDKNRLELFVIIRKIPCDIKDAASRRKGRVEEDSRTSSHKWLPG